MEACKTTLRQLLIHNAWTRTVTEVWVQEKTLPDYGCYVWPSAMVLVLWLARRQGDLLPGITDEKVGGCFSTNSRTWKRIWHLLAKMQNAAMNYGSSSANNHGMSVQRALQLTI